MRFKRVIFYLISLSLIYINNGERTKDKMYEYLDGAAACFRRLNGTHQTGCTSKRPGSTGVIHVISAAADLDFVYKTGPVPPYTLVLPFDKLTPSFLKTLLSYPDRISGVVLHKNISRPVNSSHELTCPNPRSALDGSCDSEKPWNPYGSGLMHEDIPFPIFLVPDLKSLQKITDCFEKFNNYDKSQQAMRSLCALELAAFMYATNDSRTCIRRSSSLKNFTPTRFCDLLGSRNVWSTIQPRRTKTDIILVTAHIDSTSLFYDTTPGAEAPLTGVVTLLTTAYVLKQLIKDRNEMYNTTIMFALFNGETYDYMGSQRFVYDIQTNAFPMERNDEIKHQVPLVSLSDIKLVIDLGQLTLNSKRQVFLHHAEYDTSINDEINTFYSILQNYSKPLNINIAYSTNKRLPPSSLHSFLREDKTIQGVVLSNFDTSFLNKHYHSIYDDNENIEYSYSNIKSKSIQENIADISIILAKTLYQKMTGIPYDTTQDNSIPEEPIEASRIVDELFHCYLDTANCSIYQAITLKEHISEHPFNLYVSVDPNGNKMSTLTGFVLAWLTGEILDFDRTNCSTDPHNPVYQLVWMSRNLTNINDSVCYRTTMNFSSATSPAFVIEDYDWDSNRYSSWTESVWNDIYMRMFLVPSHRHEVMTISVGTVTFVLSLALVYFVHTRADILFAKPEAVVPATSC